METISNVLEPRPPVVRVGLGVVVLARCRDALSEWRERRRVRAELEGLSNRELFDIGIARGEVDYVASNRACDPRSAVLAP